MTDVSSEKIPANVFAVGEAMPFAKAGKLWILGTFGIERDAFTPDAPTLVESGFKECQLGITSDASELRLGCRHSGRSFLLRHGGAGSRGVDLMLDNVGGPALGQGLAATRDGEGSS